MAGTEIHADTDADIDKNGSENNHADIDIERFVIFFYLCHKILSVTRGTVFVPLLLFIYVLFKEKAPDVCPELYVFQRETIMFDFTASGKSASSAETLTTKSTPNLLLILSNFLTAEAISFASAFAIFKKLSKYICCKS